MLSWRGCARCVRVWEGQPSSSPSEYSRLSMRRCPDERTPRPRERSTRDLGVAWVPVGRSAPNPKPYRDGLLLLLYQMQNH